MDVRTVCGELATSIPDSNAISQALLHTEDVRMQVKYVHCCLVANLWRILEVECVIQFEIDEL